MVAAAGVARADGDLGPVSPRAVGHAGAAVVSDDGPGALFACPAAMARRDGRRVQLGGLVVDDDVWLVGDDHPRISDRGPAELVPVIGGAGALGPVIVGIGFATTASIDRRLPQPEPGLPAATVLADFPHRYGALDARWTRRTLALGVAARPTEWLAIGVSGALSRVDARESRRVWAGFGRDMPLGYPMRDVIVAIDASDALVPGGALGALVAPADVPLELALGASWTANVDAAGGADISVANTPPATGVNIQAPTTLAAGARAAGTFASPLVLHAGVRWVGARYALEGGATAWSYRAGGDSDDAWTITDARVIDETGASAPIDRFATRIGRRSHAAVRASVDVEVVPGFAWLSAGYAWRGAGQARNATTLGGVDRGGHTLALGAELTAGNAVITLGWSRQLARDTTVLAPGLPWDNPIAPEALPANLGTYGHSRDVVGIGVEIASP